MSNQITRSIVITHSKNGLTVDFWRWKDVNTAQVMDFCKTYHPRKDKNLAIIDALLSANPPDRVRVIVKDAYIMLIYSYQTFYADHSKRLSNLAKRAASNFDPVAANTMQGCTS